MILSFPSYSDNACTINNNKFSSGHTPPATIQFTNKDLNCNDSDLIKIKHKLNEYHPIYKKVDLNGDDNCEYFMHDKNGSGSGGALYFIYSFIDGKFTNIGDYQSWGVNPASKKGGWYQLLSTDLSGGDFFLSLYIFENNKYTSTTEIFICNEETGAWETEDQKNKRIITHNSKVSNSSQLNEKGLKHYQDKEYKQALSWFKKSINVNPENWQAWNNQALTLYKLGEYKASSDISFSVYNNKKTDNKNKSNASFNIAVAQERIGEQNKSVEWLKKRIKLV